MPQKPTRSTRRGRNEGSIRWIEKKQLWEARYPYGTKEVTGADGRVYAKTMYKSIYGKKNEKGKVLQKMREALAAVGKGEYVEPSERPLYAWCLHWYETYKKPSKIRLNTKEKYITSLARLQRYDTANVQLKNLSHEILQAFYNQMAEDGLSEETIRATHTLINGALKMALMLKSLNNNPAAGLFIPKSQDDQEEKEAKALNDDESKKFLFELGRRTKHFMYALFMKNTGLRPGEALALSRNDVDFSKKCVQVNKTYIEKTKKVQNVPKTESSRRTVPIPDNIVPLLKEYMMRQPKKKPEEPLFQTETGKRPTQSYLRKRFKFAGEKAGCSWVNLHTMRHTYASQLFKKKIDIKIISKLLGHKDVSTTYNIYVHFIDNIVEDSVQVLNEDLPAMLPKKSNKKLDNVTQLEKVSTH